MLIHTFWEFFLKNAIFFLASEFKLLNLVFQKNWKFEVSPLSSELAARTSDFCWKNIRIRGINISPSISRYFAYAYFTKNLWTVITHFSWQPDYPETNAANWIFNQIFLSGIFNNYHIFVDCDFIQFSEEIIAILLLDANFERFFVDFVELVQKFLIFKIHFSLNDTLFLKFFVHL